MEFIDQLDETDPMNQNEKKISMNQEDDILNSDDVIDVSEFKKILIKFRKIAESGNEREIIENFIRDIYITRGVIDEIEDFKNIVCAELNSYIVTYMAAYNDSIIHIRNTDVEKEKITFYEDYGKFFFNFFVFIDKFALPIINQYMSEKPISLDFEKKLKKLKDFFLKYSELSNVIFSFLCILKFSPKSISKS